MNSGTTRARDADREQTVSQLHEAYVDGQLDADDRDARVTQALSAKTLGELWVLTRDLQGLATPPPAGPRRRLLATIVTTSVLAVGAVVGALALRPNDEPPPPPPPPVEVAQPEPEPVEPEPPVEPAPPEPEPEPEFVLNLKNLRAFRADYEKKFGTTQSYGADLRPDRATVYVPVRGTRPRVESYDYDGEKFVRISPPRAAPGTRHLVDLADLNFEKMLANIEVAKRSLNVTKATFDYVVFDHIVAPGEEVEVDIYVSNKYDESGRLTTRPGGTIFQRWPYDG